MKFPWYDNHIFIKIFPQFNTRRCSTSSATLPVTQTQDSPVRSQHRKVGILLCHSKIHHFQELHHFDNSQAWLSHKISGKTVGWQLKFQAYRYAISTLSLLYVTLSQHNAKLINKLGSQSEKENQVSFLFASIVFPLQKWN